jgi:hypothetical protein
MGGCFSVLHVGFYCISALISSTVGMEQLIYRLDLCSSRRLLVALSDLHNGSGQNQSSSQVEISKADLMLPKSGTYAANQFRFLTSYLKRIRKRAIFSLTRSHLSARYFGVQIKVSSCIISQNIVLVTYCAPIFSIPWNLKSLRGPHLIFTVV